MFGATRYLCECQRLNESCNAPPQVISHTQPRDLADLFFCVQCHRLRCSLCCLVRVEAKFCPVCLADHTDIAGATRCTRSCFRCPRCCSGIRPESEDVPGKSVISQSGKRFRFNCVCCDFRYQTDVVFKPAPLSVVLRRQPLSQNNRRLFFNAIVKKYSRDLERYTADKVNKVPNSGNIFGPGDISDISEAINISEDGNIPADYPILVPLTAKYLLTCSTCTTPLLRPVADPHLIKFTRKLYATDIVPKCIATINSKDAEDLSCILSIINPTPNSINVTVSITEHVPKQWAAGASVSVSMPHTTFTVPGKRDNVTLAQATPTCLLTGKTKQSRGERLARAVSTGNNQQETETGANWVSVPFVLTTHAAPESPAMPSLEDKELHHVLSHALHVLYHVPFHVAVETKVPAGWPGDAKGGLLYSFWAICKVP